MRNHEYARLRVAQIVAETDSAVSVVLEVPTEAQPYFDYQPGQFLTIRRPVNGKRLRRCYSLSSSPHVDGKHVITIKGIAGGIVSNDICSNLRVGDELESTPPSGHFVPKSLDGDFVLLAAGSGITPVMSIAKSVLKRGRGCVKLVYANRDDRSVIFRDQLRQLASAHPGRLTVVHWLESLQGLPGTDALRPLIRGWTSAEAFICGPQPFMAAATAALEQLDVDHARIHVERFVSLPDEDEDEAATAPAVSESDAATVALRVVVDGTEHRVRWPAEQALLDAMLAAGIDAPYSCRVGGCSTCMCRVVSGQIRMVHNLVLDEREIGEGWVLACQALPTSSAVSVEIP